MAKQSIFFATTSRHKLREIEKILGRKFNVKSFLDLDKIPVIEESEDTFEGNAILKAKACYDIVSVPCFADDSGLEVEALGGAPGVISSSYGGEEHNSEKNIAKLLSDLKLHNNRKAKFISVIAWFDGREIKTFKGEAEGFILREGRGNGGFGYDPIFLPQGYSQTFAEMSAELKNKISHRAKAMSAFVDFLKNA